MFFFKKKKLILNQKKEQILSRIKPIIANQLHISEDKITPEANLIKDLNIESLDTIELTMAIEEEFHIEIPDEDAEAMKTVDDILIYIEKRK